MSKDISLIEKKDLLFDPANLTVETIKKYLCKNATDQELMMGLQIAKSCNLNPIKREVYFIKYGNNPMSVVTGYEVYIKRAERSGKYAGMKSWTTGSVQDKNLVGHVEIYRKDWEKPLIHEADYFEYVQKKSDGSPNTFWKTKPKTMIKKIATSQGFRLAFPDELDGFPYTEDEIIDKDKIIDVDFDEIQNEETSSVKKEKTTSSKLSEAIKKPSEPVTEPVKNVIDAEPVKNVLDEEPKIKGEYIEGIITETIIKDVTKDGEPVKRYECKVNGEWLGSFSEKAFEEMQQRKNSGEMVWVLYETILNKRGLERKNFLGTKDAPKVSAQPEVYI